MNLHAITRNRPDDLLIDYLQQNFYRYEWRVESTGIISYATNTRPDTYSALTPSDVTYQTQRAVEWDRRGRPPRPRT